MLFLWWSLRRRAKTTSRTRWRMRREAKKPAQSSGMTRRIPRPPRSPPPGPGERSPCGAAPSWTDLLPRREPDGAGGHNPTPTARRRSVCKSRRWVWGSPSQSIEIFFLNEPSVPSLARLRRTSLPWFTTNIVFLYESFLSFCRK